ncbi:MAG: AmmeMemoRadiSam system protein B [Candidatus Binatus sp.]|uniref:AmmeMemoRadiSam system protein B n=1 Tax=Candidatus Binatus sp. TaxID=2811406 RepID=UPI00271A49EA|nr:AmmeMemoRadiSam system protein B [Candidatus Binatus sp.]MDO8430859.1 AmmeMemoRadiSam system protein B [Candidatus Binatus sp.]
MQTPLIRSVEAFPVEQQDQTFVCLRDPTGLAPEPILLGMGAYFIVTLFNGKTSLPEIQNAFAARFHETIPLEKIEELIAALDAAFFLDSPAFADRQRKVRDEFLASPERPAALAGLCYENDPGRLRLELASFFDPPDGPGRAPTAKKAASLAGLIAPHIDPRRGAAAYAHAYYELMLHEPPELVVILGTSHYGAGPQLFTATRKNYATPLGAVETDRDFVDRLAARYQGDLFADEMLHRSEHSIEFQVLFLAYALGARGYKVAPILVSSFHEMVAGGIVPASDPRVNSFLDALRAELAAESRRVLILAGVDFAHVGRKFGDSFAADSDVAARVQREDLDLIANIQRGDPAGFFADIMKDRDARRICGLSPMYTQLELLSGHAARLLKYGIAMEPQTESAVSFASLAID